MKQRTFGRTGWHVGEVGFGTWAIGGSWGEVSEHDAEAALHAALDAGVTFLDTADVYGGGRSERLIGRVLAARGRDGVVVATKAGRRLNPHVADGYTAAALEGFVEDSLRNLGGDALDLLQLHCPPTDVYRRDDVFAALDRLVTAGKLRAYGVSVEAVDEGLQALEYPIASIQVIFNLFRPRPADDLFGRAQAKGVAIIARVPLASGLLSGRMRPESRFSATDHRNFNRHGEAFDVGETFSGVPFEVGLQAVEELRAVVGADMTMAQFALRWILMHEAVSVVIPGARNPEQVASNTAAAGQPPLSAVQLEAARTVYDCHIRAHVHGRW